MDIEEIDDDDEGIEEGDSSAAMEVERKASIR